MGKTLDRNLFTEPVLMHLSKAFDCIPQDLPIAKLYAFGFNFVFRVIALFCHSLIAERCADDEVVMA